MRNLFLLALGASLAWASDPQSLSVTSAASASVGVTADSLATVYGSNISTGTTMAGLPPWLTSLGDIAVVYVNDSAGKTQMASLIYVSPSQMNLWIPPGVASGPATVQFPTTGLPPGVGAAALRTASVNIQKVAPGLFSLDGSGSGTAAASAVRVAIPSGFQSPVPVFACTATGCDSVPIDTGLDTPVYLTLYGTGIRAAGALSNAVVTIGEIQVQPTYAGPQPTFPGMDQVNVPLPLDLRGRGLVDVTVTAGGVVSNAVRIRIQ